MINAKRLLGIPAATGDAVIGKAEAPSPVIDWNDTAITTAPAANQVTFAMPNQPKVRTTNRKQSWIPLCGLLLLLCIPSTGRSDVVQDWDAIMQATVSSQPPFPQARFAAITQLAVFEAVNAITRQYKPYLGTITGPHDASPEAAAVAAAYGVLGNYFPANLVLREGPVQASDARGDPEQPSESGRNCHRPSRCGRHDRRARERRIESAPILSTHLIESRGLATNARLHGRRWTVFQLAEHDALRYPERQPVASGSTSRSYQWPVYAGV